jgi:hypothetical protein
LPASLGRESHGFGLHQRYCQKYSTFEEKMQEEKIQTKGKYGLPLLINIAKVLLHL